MDKTPANKNWNSNAEWCKDNKQEKIEWCKFWGEGKK